MEFTLAHRRFRLPFRARVRTAHGPWEAKEGLYLRVERPDGAVGWGEASPVPHFCEETVDADEAFCRSLGGSAGPETLARVPGGLGALRNALASAMGGARGPARHASLGVAALLPAGRAALQDASPKAEAGFRVFKWKVGVESPEDEMALLDDLLGALPAGSRVRLDANGAWNPRTAGRWLAHASVRPVEFVEQPVGRDAKGAEDTLRGLAADYPVPIALDESIAGDGDVGRWLDSGWPGVFVIKPALLGDVDGVLGSLAGAGARVVFSSALETGIGARASLRSAFSWPGSPLALGFGVWPLFSDSRFDGPRAGPFLRAEDAERVDPQSLWNAVS